MDPHFANMEATAQGIASMFVARLGWELWASDSLSPAHVYSARREGRKRLLPWGAVFNSRAYSRHSCRFCKNGRDVDS